MTTFEEFYKHLLQLDSEVMIEGEIAGRTMYVLHIHEDNAPRIIKMLKDVYGASVFDISKPEDMQQPSEEELDKLTREQRKQWEKASHRWVFRTYIPPTADERLFMTSEILEAFIEQLNLALKLDNVGLSRALMTNHPCEYVLAENHQYIRCNAIHSDGKTVPSISAWGLLNGLIEAVTGERLTFKTALDQPDLKDIADGKDPIVRVLRATH